VHFANRSFIFVPETKSIMIQRIQTLFLIGIAVCMGLMLNFTIWAENNVDGTEQMVLNAFESKKVALPYDAAVAPLASQSNIYIAGLAILAALVAIYSIFQFKNRLSQMKLGALNSLLMAATLGLSYYNIYLFEPAFSPQTQGSFLGGFFLPAIAMVLNMMSNRFIRKDEKLVKSVDRIR